MVPERFEAHHIHIGVGQIERRRRLPGLQCDSILSSHQLHAETPTDKRIRIV
jgi:hypothetical protein